MDRHTDMTWPQHRKKLALSSSAKFIFLANDTPIVVEHDADIFLPLLHFYNTKDIALRLLVKSPISGILTYQSNCAYAMLHGMGHRTLTSEDGFWKSCFLKILLLLLRNPKAHSQSICCSRVHRVRYCCPHFPHLAKRLC